MKLGEILKNTARPVVPRPVEFTAKGRDLNDFRVVKAKVKACLVFVDEEERQSAIVEARESVNKRFAGKAVPPQVYEDEQAFHLLFEALRDEQPTKDGTYERLCVTMDELRGCLVRDEAMRLFNEYDTYVREEFPERISDEEFNKLIEDAKKTSLVDLLNSCGFEKLVPLASFLSGRITR